MQNRTFVSARPILTAAFSVGLGLLGPSLLAQTAGTAQTPSALAGAPSVVMDRAEHLLTINQVWRAQRMLEPLTIRDGGTAMTDAERTRAFNLLGAANKKLKSIDPVEVSLQKADLAAEQGDLRMAEAQAGAALRSARASEGQRARATTTLSKVEAIRAETAPRVGEILEKAVADFDAGRFVQSKSALAMLGRSGVALSPAQTVTFETYQTRIVDVEQARGSVVVSGAAFQPGVVKKKDDPKPAPAPAPTPAADPSAPAQPPAEPAPAPVKEPEAQPAAAPPAPSQPPSQGDLIQAARKYTAQQLRAEADQDFGDSKYNQALGKYSTLVSEYKEFLTPEDQKVVNDRIAESRHRLGLNINQQEGDAIAGVIGQRQLIKQSAVAEFNNQQEQARRALESGDTVKARDLAVSSRLTVGNARSVFTEAEFEGYQKRVDELLALIDREGRAAAEAEAGRIAVENQKRQEEQKASGMAEKDRKIREAITRVRELQQQMDYESALQVVDEQILFLDPINPAGLILKDILTDQKIFVRFNKTQQLKAVRMAMGQLENQEATLYPHGIIDYPTDWPAISERRGEQLAWADSEENRRVRTVLSTKRMPVDFKGATLEGALDWVRTVTALNVDVDWPSLEAIGVQKEATVTLQLTNVSLRTILDRVLEKVSPDERSRANWEIFDGVLTIASEDVLRKSTPLVIYDIRDLLIQVPDYTNAPQFDLNSVLSNTSGGGGSGGGGQSPFRDNQGGQGAGGQGLGPGGIDRRPLDDRIKDITDIIQQNVDTEGWVDQGGSTGAIHQLNGSLIIRNTPKNHQAISGLLAKLREARAMQINVETRFLLVSQDFFEQIGFDLDVYFNAGNNQVRAARATNPNVEASDFFKFNTDPRGLQRTITAPNAAGTSTAQGVVPPLRGFSPVGGQQNSLALASSMLSGLVDSSSVAGQALGAAPALGIAGQFLDDVQVDFLIQATQADRRSVRLNAPRLTFTNGQTSNIFVATQIAFISDLTPVVSDSAVGFDPTMATISEGVRMVVEGTISADRRYVTMNIDTSVSKIDALTPRAVTAVAGGRLVNSADTQSFIQAPTVTVTSVATTVTVPDQGTILLGGQRLVNEYEVESGVPVLSKIPILNRFFSNRIKAKDEQTLLILIKPTVLIQSEQEQQNFPGLLDSLRTPYSG